MCLKRSLCVVAAGTDCVVALKTIMEAINEVVGDTEGDTQATQVSRGCTQPRLSGRATHAIIITSVTVHNFSGTLRGAYCSSSVRCYTKIGSATNGLPSSGFCNLENANS